MVHGKLLTMMEAAVASNADYKSFTATRRKWNLTVEQTVDIYKERAERQAQTLGAEAIEEEDWMVRAAMGRAEGAEGPREIVTTANVWREQASSIRGVPMADALRMPPTVMAALRQVYMGTHWRPRLSKGRWMVPTPLTVGGFVAIGDRQCTYRIRLRTEGRMRHWPVLACYRVIFNDDRNLARMLRMDEAAEAFGVSGAAVLEAMRAAGLEPAEGEAYNAIALRQALIDHGRATLKAARDAGNEDAARIIEEQVTRIANLSGKGVFTL